MIKLTDILKEVKINKPVSVQIKQFEKEFKKNIPISFLFRVIPDELKDYFYQLIDNIETAHERGYLYDELKYTDELLNWVISLIKNGIIDLNKEEM